MPFSERLGLLMAVLGVSNSTLARALSVDASLVSRWRAGTRTPAKVGTHLKAIAAYFAGQAKRDYQKAALCEVMGIPPDKRHSISSLELAQLLHAWLCGEAVPGPELVEGFIGRLEAFEGSKAGLPPAAAGKELPAGTPLQAEVFYGIEGKRQGVIRFLSAVAAQKKPGVLLLYSDESIEWFTGDRIFLAEFVAHFFDVIARGNRVKIVHVVSRGLDEMLSAIDFWLPFYLTGAIDPYYCPRYREHFFRRTMFIAPGVAALTSSTLAGRENSAPNLFCTDPALIESLTGEFNEFLGICRPLMRIFTGDNPLGLPELVTEFEEQPGDYICRSNTPTCATMPEEVFCRILGRAGMDGEKKEKMLSLQRARARALAEHIKLHKYIEIVTLPSPGEVTGGRVLAEPPDLFAGGPLFYTPQEYKSHLENVVRLLEIYPNFHFCISRRSSPKNVRLAAKDEVGVIVAKTDLPSAVFAFNQQNMTNAFYCYLEEVVSGLPQGNQDRRKVIEILRDLAGKLTD